MTCSCVADGAPWVRDYPHDSACCNCSAPHAHPGTHECTDRHACDVRALTHDVERVSFDLRSAEKAHIETLATLARRKEADRDLVVAVDVLLRRIAGAASDGRDMGRPVREAHDAVRRLITSDIYQSELGVCL